MKPLVLFHGNCLDGAGAALAAWVKFREGAEYKAMNYGDPPLLYAEIYNRDVYVLDFSFKRKEMERIAGLAKTLRLIDHHKTAMEDLEGWHNPKANVIMDMNHSGAVLTWMYFNYVDTASDVPTLLRYLEDRDLWRFEMPHCKEINAALRSHGGIEDFRNWHGLLGIWPPDVEQGLIEQGSAIIRAEAQQIKVMVEKSELIKLAGHQAVAVNATSLFSEVPDYLLNHTTVLLAPSDLAVAWHWDGSKGGRYRVSLRSRKDGPDVSEIAKRYGGGGHRNAAGFERAELPWRDRPDIEPDEPVA